MAPSSACQSFRTLLSPFVDGELDPSERVLVERHLSACHECTGRVADMRAESGLIRHGLDLAADQVDFKDFAQKVMARLEPHKPPLGERLRVMFSEIFLYQRTAMVSSLAGAAAVAAVAIPALILWSSIPEGYSRPQMAVESVTTEPEAKVAPVVMTNDKGDAIIWLVSSEAKPVESEQAQPSPDSGSAVDEKTLNQKKPSGGEL